MHGRYYLMIHYEYFYPKEVGGLYRGWIDPETQQPLYAVWDTASKRWEDTVIDDEVWFYLHRRNQVTYVDALKIMRG